MVGMNEKDPGAIFLSSIGLTFYHQVLLNGSPQNSIPFILKSNSFRSIESHFVRALFVIDCIAQKITLADIPFK
jgi:hypothetical protein